MATVRPATRDDLPAILEIYNEAVLNLTASYDYDPQTLDQRRQWFEARTAASYPVLVAEEAGHVLGWGALGPFRDRIGYRFTAEDSIYIAPDARGRGIGKLLLADLIQAARIMGLHALIAGADTEGAASIRLHESFGFKRVAHFREVGYKFGRWLDVVFLELVLDEGGTHGNIG